MTHIFNEEMKIAHAGEMEEAVPVATSPEESLSELSLLQEILLELKKINVHLEEITDMEVSEEDTK
jgi:hypothetical protein